MNFTYHPPTRTVCHVCEQLGQHDVRDPIVNTINGKSSSANGYLFHNWYNFVLGFTPTFPNYMLEREQITANDLVLDPFAGSGTTQLVCKLKGIPSMGVDANDFMVFAAKEKLNWSRDIQTIVSAKNELVEQATQRFAEIDWANLEEIAEAVSNVRPEMLDQRYMSDKPFYKVHTLQQLIAGGNLATEIRSFLSFALSSILVSVSNIKYGPGFGVGAIKDDVDVLAVFTQKTDQMIKDLQNVTQEQIDAPTSCILGDSRKLGEYVNENSVSLIVTSPPYPGDHEYTKHSKIELIFQGMATDITSFRTIKKRMLSASTTNIYKEDNDGANIINIQSISEITRQIDERLQHDGATSGFEKLYTRLVKEYFGGMAVVLEQCYRVLCPGGKIALLVSDSHAFKMVHIQTASILSEIGVSLGFVDPQIELWQMKNSTSHKYQLRENILILQKSLDQNANVTI